ncbi:MULTISPECIES: GGDEF domain-containing protein [unclassified Sphingomonas]|uniref:GGDEF domain-containing protein n=1 Tax=unclassified Sphingomonas TaxID=196159 RepID=UPI0007022E05|nr:MULTISPECIES: GGDEF domain-containing protein [unclassified Sphingomonas]KQX20720.1 diguanylate cyclase [Sphingomonas sp. Root1294]KQY68566.1 diguanylate cyclase [Sphingomonas sp. Root50]KRB87972.1 diguanylate cyclase [Sphingomonas sp. Root720]
MNLLRSLIRGRRRAVRPGGERLPDATYVELVQSLFGYTAPAMIMTLCFAGTGAFLMTRIDDPLLLLFYGLGLIASAIRLFALFGLRRRAMVPGLGVHVASAIERGFGLAYIGFAVAFGAFAARAYAIATPDLHIPLVALVYGYGAGVAATVALRLWISVTAILIAIVPMILTAMLMPDGAHWGAALLTALFLAGGVMSMVQRYHETAAQISMRRLMETLARQDDLTGLPNRLVLRERFEQLIARADESELIAVHCLDINQLEPVNEMYGHMAGDALLKAIAQRLRRVVRGDNLVIHLNGDDFVVIQPGMADAAEAQGLAHQIVATLDKSYAVAGEDIIITANIGYAIDLQQGADLERLLLSAERALKSSKRGATGVSAYDGTRWGGAAGENG